MEARIAITSTPIHALLAKRWSPRAFVAGKPVSREQLLTLLEATRWSPSCNGDEPWRYLMWDRERDPHGFQRAFECLSENNRKWVKNVPQLMLGCANSIFNGTGKPSRWGQHDVGMANLSLCLQAVALGLAAHQMGGFDAEKARAAFSIPAGYTPMSMVAIGIQAEPDVLDDETQAKELRPRARRPLAESFYEGSWGKGFA